MSFAAIPPRSFLIAPLLLLLHAQQIGACTFLVNPDGSGDFPTIQAAVDAAVDGDIICLGDGTFTGPGNHSVYCDDKNLTIKSLNGIPENCIMNVLGSPGNYRNAFTFSDCLAELQGITMTNAYSFDGGAVNGFWAYNFVIRDCRFIRNRALGDGGAIWTNNDLGTDLTVEDCYFEGNHADLNGGAIFIEDAVENGTFVLRRSQFIDNSADSDGGALGQTSAQIEDCVFVGNDAGGIGGAIVTDAYGWIERSVFVRNSANLGGAVHGGVSIIDSCVFSENEADVGAAIFAVWNTAIGASSFWGNAAWTGGVIHSFNSDFVSIDKTIIASSTLGSAVSCGGDVGPAMSCCDVWGNAGGDWIGCIASQAETDGNFSADPMFCDPEGGEFQIRSCSPCVNAPGCGLVGAEGPGDCGRIWLVPNDIGTIQEALETAVCGDTVEVACGTYHESDIALKSDVVLCSETGQPDCVTIDAQGLGRVLSGDELSTSTVIEGLTLTGGSLVGHGAGIYLTNSLPVIRRCIIANNSAGEPGSGHDGGGIYCRYSSPTLEESMLFGNWADDKGGGMFCKYESWPYFNECVFAANRAENSGGGLYCWGGADAEAEGLTFWGNSSPIGGAICSVEGTEVFLDRTIVSFSEQGEAVSCEAGGTASLVCSDVYGNAGGDWVGYIAGQFGIDGNIREDPLFCNPLAEDFTLRDDSPCLDAAGCGQIGALGEGCSAAFVDPAEVAGSFRLQVISPNPLREVAKIGYALGAAGSVRLIVYDLTGRYVATVFDGSRPPGEFVTTWLGTDDQGRKVVSGIYFIQMMTERFEARTRICLLR